jgi:hypothetical protein
MAVFHYETRYFIVQYRAMGRAPRGEAKPPLRLAFAAGGRAGTGLAA